VNDQTNNNNNNNNNNTSISTRAFHHQKHSHQHLVNTFICKFAGFKVKNVSETGIISDHMPTLLISSQQQ